MITAYRHTNLEHLLTFYYEHLTRVNEALFAKWITAEEESRDRNSEELEE